MSKLLQSRRNVLLLALPVLTLAPEALFAQSYPSKVITVVVPFAPGGTVDVVGRTVAPALSRALRDNAVIVRNDAGASAEIGTAAVVRATPDGYTLLMGSTTSISIRPQMLPPAAYEPQKDLLPIALAASVPHVLLTSPTVGARSVQELVSYARANKRPLNLGDSGAGSPHALAGSLFSQASGIDITHISYKGTSAVLTDLLAGHIDIASVELSVAAPYIKSDKLFPIGLSASRRDAAWPNLPTIAEQGISNYEITSWFGFFAPAGTPAAIQASLNGAIGQALTDPAVKEKLTSAGLTIMGGSTADFQAHLARERTKWARAILASGGKLRTGS